MTSDSMSFSPRSRGLGPATDPTIRLLARIAAWRHGTLAVVRGPARRERAPTTISAL
jgi:hypothetical protein